jgi:type I restriction enzyme S subunit
MTVPKLRFKEFDGGWTKSTIQFFMDNNFILDQMDGNHGELYPKSEEFSATGVPYISATDFSFGDVNFATCKRLPIERAKLFKKGIAKNGDVLFAHNATVGPVAILKTDLDFVILSTTATYYRCEATYLNNHYLKNYFESDFFVQQYFGIMSQSTRNQVPITTQRKLNIAVPNIQEQTKIASFLSAVDEKISQLTQKHELLSQYKQGMMQKLFSQQLRFKADDGSEFGEWENSYIGNECKITTGNKDTQNKVDDGLYPFFVRSQTVEKINSYSMDCEAILTSGDGVGVGKNYHYMNGKFDFHQRVYCLYEFSERLIGRYLYIYFSNYFYDRVKRLSAKNSVDSVRMDMISKMEIKLPCLEEQTKIANFLSAIDQKIEVVAQQIEQAKQWKKGLLQQMFI